MGPHLGVLRADTIVIGWMGSSAAFQTLTPQSLCLEVFGFFSLFNLVPGWEKLLMALTRKTTKFFTGWYLDGCISARLAFRVLCQCIAHRYCLLAALVCLLCKLFPSLACCGAARDAQHPLVGSGLCFEVRLWCLV